MMPDFFSSLMFSVHQKSGNSLTGHFSFMSAVGDLFALPTQGCQIKFNFDSNGGVHIQLVRIEDRVFWPIQMKTETQEGTGEGTNKESWAFDLGR